MESLQSYIYTPLDPITQEIRLIALHPNVNLTAPVILTLHTASLVADPKFEAISYVWGDPTITALISLNGVAVEVTTNLETALRYFRLASQVRILWADAVCINQRDNLERNVQVSMMGDIYRSCTKCLAWLGEDLNGNGEATFAMIKEISTGTTTPFVECVDMSEHPKSWLTSLDQMMQIPYWTRIWVIQETVLPLHAEYWCGRSTIDRKVWLGACRPVGYQHISQTARLCEACNLGLIAFLSEAGNLISRDSGTSFHAPYSCEDSIWVLSYTNGLLCLNPLDKFYAIRALTTPVFQSSIAVDYTNATLNRLSAQILQADIIDSGSLRMLCMVDRVDYEGESSCPSWWPLPQWKPELVDIYETSSPSTKSKVVQDPNFHASGSSKMLLDFECVEDGILGLSSILVDTIEAVSWFGDIDSSTFMDTVVKQIETTIGLSREEGLIRRSCGDQGEFPSLLEGQTPSQYVGGGTTRDAWWRTLVSDHVLKEENRWVRADQAEEQTFWNLWNKMSKNRISDFVASTRKTEDPEFNAFLVFHYTTNDRSF
ncbi:hypothetical protein IFR05_011019 [Cadophora sp. M221]|nr:hypothetical protein IFR05_011019 [Cadophora sp. M221]